VERLVKAVWPTANFGESKLMSTLYEKQMVKHVLNERYFRAIAKIGFHYFQTQFSEYEGRELIFSEIRRFIHDDLGGPINRVNSLVGLRQEALIAQLMEPNSRSHLINV
jgi:hypothetical protein